jgi:hypothetical protein
MISNEATDADDLSSNIGVGRCRRGSVYLSTVDQWDARQARFHSLNASRGAGCGRTKCSPRGRRVVKCQCYMLHPLVASSCQGISPGGGVIDAACIPPAQAKLDHMRSSLHVRLRVLPRARPNGPGRWCLLLHSIITQLQCQDRLKHRAPPWHMVAPFSFKQLSCFCRPPPLLRPTSDCSSRT